MAQRILNVFENFPINGLLSKALLSALPSNIGMDNTTEAAGAIKEAFGDLECDWEPKKKQVPTFQKLPPTLPSNIGMDITKGSNSGHEEGLWGTVEILRVT